MTIQPTATSTSTSTEFHFTILFGCDLFNPNLASLDQLKMVWETFVEEFQDNAVIRDNFTFPADDAPTQGELTPVPPSPPPKDEALINGATGYAGGLFRVVIALTAVLFFFFF